MDKVTLKHQCVVNVELQCLNQICNYQYVIAMKWILIGVKKMSCVYSNDQINRIPVPKPGRSGVFIANKIQELTFEEKCIKINQNYTEIKMIPCGSNCSLTVFMGFMQQFY